MKDKKPPITERFDFLSKTNKDLYYKRKPSRLIKPLPGSPQAFQPSSVVILEGMKKQVFKHQFDQIKDTFPVQEFDKNKIFYKTRKTSSFNDESLKDVKITNLTIDLTHNSRQLNNVRRSVEISRTILNEDDML